MMLQRFIPRTVIVFFCFFVLLISTFLFQTTIWFNWLGSIPAPNLWLPIFVYLMINREKQKRLFWFSVFYFLFLSCSVAQPLQILISISATFAIIDFVQSRFSTLSIFDLVLFSGGSIITFPLLYSVVDFLFSSFFYFDIFFHIGNLALSIPLIPLVLMICRKIDQKFSIYNTTDGLVMDL
ncbi:hypothetical protein K2X05_00515 [bacterium]|nr:hypothetical protein [bacterium]